MNTSYRIVVAISEYSPWPKDCTVCCSSGSLGRHLVYVRYVLWGIRYTKHGRMVPWIQWWMDPRRWPTSKHGGRTPTLVQHGGVQWRFIISVEASIGDSLEGDEGLMFVKTCGLLDMYLKHTAYGTNLFGWENLLNMLTQSRETLSCQDPLFVMVGMTTHFETW